MKSLTNLPTKNLFILHGWKSEALFQPLSIVTRTRSTRNYLLVKDKYLAEDIFQDAFIRIIDTLKGGRIY